MQPKRSLLANCLTAARCAALVLLAGGGGWLAHITLAQDHGGQGQRRKADTEMARIAGWMTGDFDTFAQVARDEAGNTSYRHVRAVLHIAPIEIAGIGDGRAFYVEQALADALDQPYRQRIYFITRLNGQLVNRIYKIKDPAQFVGGYKDAKLLAPLTLDRVTLEEGCDLIWQRASAKLYKGVAGADGQCKSTLRGATHTISHAELTPETLTSLDQGFDDAKNHKWGPPPGTVGHIFVKRMAAENGGAKKR